MRLPLLQVEDLTVSYHRVPAIHHLSLTLDSGHCVGLFGPNGAGKSTLLKTIAGLLTPETGRILLGGKLIRGKTSGSSSLIAYLPQRETIDWDFPVTVEGLVEMGRYHQVGLFGSFSSQDRDAVREALELFQLTPLAHRQIKALSGGQQQRAFLARAWVQEADLYLLDEPFAGLDRTSSAALAEALQILKTKRKLLVVSHHALNEAASLFDTAILLNGELVSCGPISTALSPSHLECAYGTAVYSGSGN
jgi:manganese/iron transport system ATP-binding protein/manganese/zinc/iron transport system ATP- binding protein